MSGVNPPETFELSQSEKHSALWLRLKSHLLDRLDDARLRNDRMLSEHETAILRGEILALKHMLELGEDRPMLGEDQP